MTESISDRFKQFATRTHLLRVLTLYFSASFVALQLVDMFADRLKLPDALFTITLLLVIAGLPLLVIAVAMRDRRLGAHKPSSDPHHRQPHPALTWRRVGITVVGLFALWGIVAAGWLLVGPPVNSEPDTRPAVGELKIDVPDDVVATIRPVATADSLAVSAEDTIETRQTVELPAGEYLLRLMRNGYNEVMLLMAVAAGRVTTVPVSFVRDVAETRGMTAVAASPNLPAFLIDRYEVTNAEYLEFVRAGGYNGSQMAGFVDRSGARGPRFWSGGIYPQGTAALPVVGVSWQEAAAYARWRGKQLPTWEQWWRAALADGRKLPWGDVPDSTGARANFNLIGADSAGAHPLGVSHVGAHDMAGNVREWLRTGRSDPNKRIAVGGSWQDPTYLFDPEWVEEFPPDYASELIGFRCVLESRGQQP